MRYADEENGCLSYDPVDVNKRCFYIFGFIDNKMAVEICRATPYLADSKEDITIFINSIGGDLDAFCSIMSALRLLKCKIKIFIVGEAYSAAAMMALLGDEVYASKFSNMMHHNMVFGLMDDGKEVKERLELNQKQFDNIYRELLKGTKISFDKFQKKINKNNWWMTAEEAKKYGFIHEIF